MSEKPKGALVYWIEESTLAVRSVLISPDQLRGGSSFEHEASYKMTPSIGRPVTVLLERAGMSDPELDELRRTAEALKAESVQKGEASR